jgi:hypothetical protein
MGLKRMTSQQNAQKRDLTPKMNPICKAFAERLKEKGKPSIVIIGAIMTKLLHLIYGVLKSEKPFNPDILKKAQITP